MDALDKKVFIIENLFLRLPLAVEIEVFGTDNGEIAIRFDTDQFELCTQDGRVCLLLRPDPEPLTEDLAGEPEIDLFDLPIQALGIEDERLENLFDLDEQYLGELVQYEEEVLSDYVDDETLQLILGALQGLGLSLNLTVGEWTRPEDE